MPEPVISDLALKTRISILIKIHVSGTPSQIFNIHFSIRTLPQYDLDATILAAAGFGGVGSDRSATAVATR